MAGGARALSPGGLRQPGRTADRAAPGRPFTVDGEMFDPLPDRAVVITAADRARFVRL